MADNLSAINKAENPFKVSVDIVAAGVAENNFVAQESGYSNAIKNDAIIGISPEFTYTDGLKVEDVIINFDLDSSVVNNTNGKYTSLSDEFVGIKRLNVFKFFEDVNMLLPIETFHDVENNRVYTHVDELGTYCLMDMEIWLDNLGIKADGYSTTNVQPSSASSNDPDPQDTKQERQCIDVVIVVYPDKSLLDKVKEELVNTSKRIFAESKKQNKDCRIYYVTFLYSSILSPTGKMYAENIDEAETIIKRYAGITSANQQSTYPLYKAMNYVKNSCLPEFRINSNRYCFVIDACGYPSTTANIGAISMLEDNNVNISFSYNRGNPNELTYTLLSSICEQAKIENGRYN